MSALPTGTVSFLFTDVEGSTKLLGAHPEVYRRAVRRHHDLLLEAVQIAGGAVFETVGDAVYAAFARPTDAIKAALWGQLALQAEDWGETPLKVRMGIHSGEVELQGEHYFGAPLYRCARLMSTAHGGQVVLSQAVADLVRDALPDGATLRDLGEHRLKDLARPERVYQLNHEQLPAQFAPLRSLDTLPNNLPLQVTTFIGREREMAEVTKLLGTVRLLTLTGPGGTGKTRLSLQVAADSLEDFPDGVWLVELASLSDPAQVTPSVAGVLSVKEELGRPLVATLTDVLRTKRCLLVLDNCEHLIEACAALVDSVIRSCPNVQVLATSREALGIAGETSWRVPSLGVPDAANFLADQPDVALRLSQFESVRLFVDRATSVQPGFQVTNQNAPAVAQICHRLDGIPLAIELAAARVRALAPEQLLLRLEDRFRLLTGGSRTAMPRQQTLQALVDWSYGLLSDPEKALFNRLSVFSGGFSLEAAERVCSDAAVDEYDVLDLLTHLVDKSLVIAEVQSDGQTRYRLLETLRQYARQRLLERGEAEKFHERHAAYFSVFALEATPHIRCADQIVWLQRLDVERENLRGALRWYVESGSAEEALTLAGALWWFWLYRGYYADGREQLVSVLALPNAVVFPAEHGRALVGVGYLAWTQGDYAAAHGAFEESIALATETGDRKLLALSLVGQGNNYNAQGSQDVSLQTLSEGLAVAREVGDRWVEAWALNRLAVVRHMPDGTPESLEALKQEALSQWRALGDRWGISPMLRTIGERLAERGDLDAATPFLDESLQAATDLGDTHRIASALASLADLARQQRDFDLARSYLDKGKQLARDSGLTRNLGRLCYAHARVALEAGDLDEALAEAEETCRIMIAAGQEYFAVFAHGLSVTILLKQGDVEGAYRRAQVAHELAQKLAVSRACAFSLILLGKTAYVRGEVQSARRYFLEALELARNPDCRSFFPFVLEGLASVAAAETRHERALQLAGAAFAVRPGTSTSGTWQADLDQALTPARQALDQPAQDAAWQAGASMDFAAALHLAEEETVAGKAVQA